MTQTRELENSPISLLLLKFSIPAITGTVITSFYKSDLLFQRVQSFEKAGKSVNHPALDC